MDSETSRRPARGSRPALEPLEGRALLSASGTGLSAGQTAGTGAVKRLDYVTPQGSHVDIRLYGVGTLAGSSVEPGGALDLVFSGTNGQSGIIGHVRGGDGRAPLRSLHPADLPAGSLTGLGGSLIDVVNLKDFDLVSGGRVNLEPGVHVLFLNSTAADTQVSLREIPLSILQGGTAAVTQNGVTLAYATGAGGGQTLAAVSGQFVPGPNLVVTRTPTPVSPGTAPGAPPAPPGVVVSINHVDGPGGGAAAVPGSPQVFGYDPVANALIRFDTATGDPTLTIPNALPGGPGTEAGVALGRDNGKLVALVSDGSNVYAFDPTDGARVGQFSTAGLGLAGPTRLGSFDAFTVLGTPATAADALGQVRAVDLTRSLATRTAVPVGSAFTSQRAFGLSGGLTGVAGLPTLFAAGATHFDPYQPAQFQLGVASLSPSGSALRESSRAAFTNAGATVNTDARGSTATAPADALGGVDQLLALDTGLATDASGRTTNTVSLYSPTTFARVGSVALNDPNRLSGLSGSFRPALAGSALVDVQGNTQSFRAHDARGLVFVGEGNVNLVKIDRADSTAVVGFPFGHAAIPNRTGVTILSSARVVHGRNGVIERTNIRPPGPLSLP